ncbi:HlyD family secretion protein [Thalassolituus sp. LLYu03]|uniref:HlyD family secretion protein n=1 Tax=Thalassolituus sp. LLYu03 TaxID=3421656 RepID=UPI003D2B9CB9
MNTRTLILVSLTAASGVLLSACGNSEAGRAMGTLERDRITLTSPASETVTSSPVHEGQSVRAGDLLLQLDPTRAQAALNAQQAQLQQAEARLAELQSGARPEERAAATAQVEGARAALTEASQQLTRAKALRAQNLTGQADVDAAVARRDSAAATLLQAQEQLAQLTNGTRAEQLAQAEAAVASARALTNSAAKSLSDLSLTAPVAGRVDALPWHTGDRINTGIVAVTLLADSEPYARVYLPANALTSLSAGQTVQVRVDGLDQPFTGTLTNIRSQPAFTPYFALNERDRAALMYLSEVRFTGNDASALRDIPTGRTLEVLHP